MARTSPRLRRARRIKRENTLLLRALRATTEQRNYLRDLLLAAQTKAIEEQKSKGAVTMRVVPDDDAKEAGGTDDLPLRAPEAAE